MNQTCTTCGTALAQGALRGLCPACLLSSALENEVEDRAPPPLPGTGRFGEYELIEEIGRGGMGVVYRARQRSLNRDVALKILLSGRHADSETVHRFRTEAETAAALQHPNIVAIHEIGEVDGLPFLTMDFVAGRNLAQVCGSRPISTRFAASLTRSIAEAVQHAHDHGVLHRDLKPSNVLLDSEDRPRVTDFGLAKRLSDTGDSTITGLVLGSPNYASPEQAAGRTREVGVPSDVYGVGALLYHLLTGRPPFLAGTPTATLQLVLSTDPVAPRRLNPTVPRDLETLCLKCLQKDPARRYASARALFDELDRFMRGEPIKARPVSSLEQTWRWCQRHPAAATMAVITIAALATTSAILFVSNQRIGRARSQEGAARLTAEESLYTAKMFMASVAMSVISPDLRAVRLHLDTVRPAVGRPEMRGFEWRYLWKASRGNERTVLSGHEQVIVGVAFSPDGSQIATHSLDGSLRVWDADDARTLRVIPGVARCGGFTADNTVFFSQPDNSIWKLFAGAAEPVRVVDKAGRLIAVRNEGRDLVVFGPDNLPVAVRVGDAFPEMPRIEIPIDTAVAVSRDGANAAVAGRIYPGIVVMDLNSGGVAATLVDPRPVIAVALSPNGSRLVSAGFDGVLKVWEVATGRIEHQFRAFLDPVWGVDFSPDGQLIAVGGNNRLVKVWDTETWTERKSFLGHEDTIWTVAFSPDGRRIVSGGQDSDAFVWTMSGHDSPAEVRGLLRGPEWAARTPHLAFSPDGGLFAGTAADGTVKVWRTDTMECRASFPAAARTVAFSPEGSEVLAEDYDGTIRRWRLDGGELEETLSPSSQFANWSIDALRTEHRVAIVADQPGPRADCRLCEIPSARDGTVAGAVALGLTIAVAPDSETIFVGLPTGIVEAWSLRDRRPRFSFPAHKLFISAIAVSPDGRYLATGSADNTTKLWDTSTGAYLATYQAHNRPVWALAFSPDSQTLASGSCDKAVILCSVPLRRELMNLWLYEGVPQGYEQEVRFLSFSPDGNVLAAALGDGTVRFFRAATFAETDNLPLVVAGNR